MGSPIETGAVLDGRFRVERVIGTGAMGIVVAARHIALREPVAIKFLKAELTEDAALVARFEREARAAARLRSEHIAKVSDVGRLASGEPYMVMEYLEGQDLSEYLEERGPLPLLEVAEHLLQACEALAEAHALGIVHRDLKPANLFLTTRADRSACIKVLDFGISKFADGAGSSGFSATLAGGLVGSPLYMSPEQIEAATDVDSRSDVWTLGIILFELLTGSMPFSGTNLPQICMAIVTAAPSSLRALRPDLPQGVEELVLACLEKNRDARLSSVAEFARRLSDFGPEHGRLSAMRAARIAERHSPMTRAVPAGQDVVAKASGAAPSTALPPDSVPAPSTAQPPENVEAPSTAPPLSNVASQVTVPAPAVPGRFPRRALLFGGASVAAMAIALFFSVVQSPKRSDVAGAALPRSSATPGTSSVVGESAPAARKTNEEPVVSIAGAAPSSSAAAAAPKAPPKPRAVKAAPSPKISPSAAAPTPSAEPKPLSRPPGTVEQRTKSLGGRI